MTSPGCSSAKSGSMHRCHFHAAPGGNRQISMRGAQELGDECTPRPSPWRHGWENLSKPTRKVYTRRQTGGEERWGVGNRCVSRANRGSCGGNQRLLTQPGTSFQALCYVDSLDASRRSLASSRSLSSRTSALNLSRSCSLAIRSHRMAICSRSSGVTSRPQAYRSPTPASAVCFPRGFHSVAMVRRVVGYVCRFRREKTLSYSLSGSHLQQRPASDLAASCISSWQSAQTAE
jgi:hypothetical protein